ncbi:hypothetical protein MNV49_007722 [Pseudohyphozyma bogoriensis]|nr:hypothetical protein MNV49_007722 [Pseudohyphozyma bogoriensis]
MHTTATTRKAKRELAFTEAPALKIVDDHLNKVIDMDKEHRKEVSDLLREHGIKLQIESDRLRSKLDDQSTSAYGERPTTDDLGAALVLSRTRELRLMQECVDRGEDFYTAIRNWADANDLCDADWEDKLKAFATDPDFIAFFDKRCDEIEAPPKYKIIQSLEAVLRSVTRHIEEEDKPPYFYMAAHFVLRYLRDKGFTEEDW